MNPRYFPVLKNATLLFLILFSYTSSAQTYYGQKAQNILSGGELIRMDERSNVPEFFRLKKGITFVEDGFHKMYNVYRPVSHAAQEQRPAEVYNNRKRKRKHKKKRKQKHKRRRR